MNTTKEARFSDEDRKTILTTSVAGAAIGLLYAYGFEFGILVGLLGGAAFGATVGIRIIRKPPKMRFPRILLRRVLIAAGLFSLSAVIYSQLLDQNLNNSQRLWAAFLPLAGWIALVVSIGMAISQLDELQRRIQLEAIALAFAGTGIFAGGYSLFYFAGLSEMNAGVIFFVMAFMWLLGKLWTLWKYQ